MSEAMAAPNRDKTRGQRLREILANDGRSVRWTEMRAGYGRNGLQRKVRGEVPLDANDFETIAPILHMSHVDLYIAVNEPPATPDVENSMNPPQITKR